MEFFVFADIIKVWGENGISHVNINYSSHGNFMVAGMEIYIKYV